MKKSTFEEFKEKARATHEGAYTYPDQEWAGYRTVVTVVCRVHGEFRTLASNHVAKTGCPSCAEKSKLLSPDEFKARVASARGTGLNLDLVEYKGGSTKVVVVCSEHGQVLALPAVLLRGGKGCPKCGQEGRKASAARAVSLGEAEWLSRFKEAHGDSYTYLGLEWVGQAKVRVLCHDHGEFYQAARMHASGQGCPACGREKIPGRPGEGREGWLSRFTSQHGDTYDYPDTSPVGASLTQIVCKTHGPFTQRGSDHVRGSGCSRCSGYGPSKGQMELTEFCRSLSDEVQADYKFHGRRELDIYVPTKALGIEFDGLYWHSEEVAGRLNIARKDALARSKGIRVIHVFEDEWAKSRGAVEATIRHALGKSPRVFARRCDLLRISSAEAGEFHRDNHVQGSVEGGLLHLALQHQGRVVMVMTFTRLNSNRIHKEPGAVELRRLSSTHCVVGGASKLFKAAVDILGVSSVVSYSDNRAFPGGVYEKMGFKKAGVSRPDYYYVRGGSQVRHRKSNFTRSRLASHPDFDASKSEAVNMKNMGWGRLYDSGKTKWVWTKL